MGKLRYSKEERIILKIIKPYGYSIVKGKHHPKIVDQQGRCLLGYAGTPSEHHWYKNVINQLIKNGKLPGAKKL